MFLVEESFHWEICKISGKKPQRRAAHCSAIYHDKLYIFGGYSDSSSSALKNCSVLSFENMQWNNLEIKGADFLPVYGVSSVILKNEIYIMGGYYQSADTKSEIQIYNFREDKLRSIDIQGDDYIPTVGGTAAIYENNIFLLDGLTTPLEAAPKLFCLQLNEEDCLEDLYTGENHSFIDYTESLLGSEQHADVHFSIEGKQIPANKLVLSLRCKYFSNLFSSGMKESNSDVIEIEDIKFETFQALLKFLYQNEVKFTEELALDLYEVSHKYMQSELNQLCEQFLSKKVRFKIWWTW